MTLAGKLAEERRARLAAERRLELKQAELHAANRKLGQHALALTRRIGATEAEVATVRDENAKVKSDLTLANEKVEIAERRLWLSIQSIQDGFAFFDSDGHMIGANAAYLSFFDDLEEVAPGIGYARILQLLTDEGIVNTENHTPDEWRATMLARWHMPAPESIIVRLWNDQYIRLIDQRGHGGDVVSLALNITDSVRYQSDLHEARQKAEMANRTEPLHNDTPVRTTPIGKRKMRILAAEDNKTNRLVLSKMLKSLNAELHFAENGEEAVEAYSALHPDMIFMDISMPILDGKSATRRIRDLEAKDTMHTPIIALTAHVLESDQDEIMQSGIDLCMTKPLRKDKILEQVRLHHPKTALPLDEAQR